MTSAQKAVERSPTDPFILDSLGWVHYRLGNFSLALESLRKAFNICQDPEIAEHLREVLWTKSRIEEANVLQFSSKKFQKDISTAVLSGVSR